MLLAALLVASASVTADEVRVAVAANFSAAMDSLAADFMSETGHRLVVSKGSTGKLFAQIRLGAPFDLFLAADQAYPARLVTDGVAIEGTQITYAVGRLVVLGEDCHALAPLLVNARRVAIANPALAPYGRAARESLESAGLWSGVASKNSTRATFTAIPRGSAS